jgi:hypothetical protein
MARDYKVITRDESKRDFEEGFRCLWGPFTDAEADAFLGAVCYVNDPNISGIKLRARAGDQLRRPDMFVAGSSGMVLPR